MQGLEGYSVHKAPAKYRIKWLQWLFKRGHSLGGHVLDAVNKPKRKTWIADMKNYGLNKQKDSELLYF